MCLPGVIDAVCGFGVHGHVCWAYDDHEEFRCRVVELLTDGLVQGQRLCYIASGNEAALWEDLRGLDRLDEARRAGVIQVHSLEATYHNGDVIEPAGQMQISAAAEEALAAGFTGFRVAAEVTPLVRTPEQLDAFARFEHIVDRYMTSRPFSAMCAYDRTELGVETIAQVACMHPNANPGATPFRLHASTRAAAALGGELDLAAAACSPSPCIELNCGPPAVSLSSMRKHSPSSTTAACWRWPSTSAVTRWRCCRPAFPPWHGSSNFLM